MEALAALMSWRAISDLVPAAVLALPAQPGSEFG